MPNFTGAVKRKLNDVLGDHPTVLNWIPADLRDAVRDGSNTEDLTEYVQAAIDARSSFANTGSPFPPSGGSLEFPEGVYLVSGLVSPPNMTYHRKGGARVATLKVATANGKIFDNPDGFNNCTFEGLTFEAYGDVFTTPSGNGGYAFYSADDGLGVPPYTARCIWRCCHFSTQFTQAFRINAINCEWHSCKGGFFGVAATGLKFAYGTMTASGTTLSAYDINGHVIPTFQSSDVGRKVYIAQAGATQSVNSQPEPTDLTGTISAVANQEGSTGRYYEATVSAAAGVDVTRVPFLVYDYDWAWGSIQGSLNGGRACNKNLMVGCEWFHASGPEAWRFESGQGLVLVNTVIEQCETLFGLHIRGMWDIRIDGQSWFEGNLGFPVRMSNERTGPFGNYVASINGSVLMALPHIRTDTNYWSAISGDATNWVYRQPAKSLIWMDGASQVKLEGCILGACHPTAITRFWDQYKDGEEYTDVVLHAHHNSHFTAGLPLMSPLSWSGGIPTFSTDLFSAPRGIHYLRPRRSFQGAVSGDSLNFPYPGWIYGRGSISSGSNSLACTVQVAGDHPQEGVGTDALKEHLVGRWMWVWGAGSGGDILVAQVTAVSNDATAGTGVITLSSNASTTVTNARYEVSGNYNVFRQKSAFGLPTQPPMTQTLYTENNDGWRLNGLGSPARISSVTHTGTTFEFTTTTNHGLVTGDVMYLSNVHPILEGSVWACTRISDTVFRINSSALTSDFYSPYEGTGGYVQRVMLAGQHWYDASNGMVSNWFDEAGKGRIKADKTGHTYYESDGTTESVKVDSVNKLVDFWYSTVRRLRLAWDGLFLWDSSGVQRAAYQGSATFKDSGGNTTAVFGETGAELKYSGVSRLFLLWDNLIFRDSSSTNRALYGGSATFANSSGTTKVTIDDTGITEANLAASKPVRTSSGSKLTTGNTDLASEVTGTLPVANGGTGAATTDANKVFAGPLSGSAAAPAFRVLAQADLPELVQDSYSANFDLSDAHDLIYISDTCTCTLHSAASARSKTYIFVIAANKTLTLAPASGESIDGGSSKLVGAAPSAPAYIQIAPFGSSTWYRVG